MTRILNRAETLPWTALGMRWLVLAALVFGTVISSFGGTRSHGIAVLAATSHTGEAVHSSAHDHGHSHEDEEGGEWALAALSLVTDHAHHGADHSHDKAHALPTAWYLATRSLPVWLGQLRPWTEQWRADRLERPPMG